MRVMIFLPAPSGSIGDEANMFDAGELDFGKDHFHVAIRGALVHRKINLFFGAVKDRIVNFAG
jgi:hypothetical protein